MTAESSPQAQAVRVSSRSFTLWWLAFLLLHGIAAIFFGFCALFYWQLEGTYLDECLQFYGIGMETSAYSRIAILQGLVAVPHALVILKMIGASLNHWSFGFTFGSAAARRGATKQKKQKRKSQQGPRSTAASVAPSANQGAPSGRQPRVKIQTAFKWSVWATQTYHFFCDRDGIFGVEGKYFHLILFCRELIETSLQTNQAYRMSFYLPRVWLNRFYVTLLVLNCWITPLIHFAYKKNEARKRLLSLVCDCALDLAASVLIPCTIVATYYDAYDSKIRGFDPMLYYDDVWLLHINHDFQILLVTSWRDLSTRLVFALGMIIAMADIKELAIGVYSNNQVTPLTAMNPSQPAASAAPLRSNPNVSALVV